MCGMNARTPNRQADVIPEWDFRATDEHLLFFCFFRWFRAGINSTECCVHIWSACVCVCVCVDFYIAIVCGVSRESRHNTLVVHIISCCAFDARPFISVVSVCLNIVTNTYFIGAFAAHDRWHYYYGRIVFVCTCYVYMYYKYTPS